MSERKFYLESRETIQLSRGAVRRVAESRDANAALLYVYLLSGDGHYQADNAAAALGLSQEDTEQALKTLERLGVLTEQERLEGEKTVYSADALAKGLASDETFSQLVREMEQVLGRVLSPSDLNSLYVLYQELLLPPDVLVMAAAHCVQEMQKRCGPGRRTTLRQVEREARIWARDGVNDAVRADRYLRAREQKQSQIYQMLHQLQIFGRAPTETEERYLRSFIEMGFTPEAVYHAYDITLVKVGALRWSYLSAILKKWHEKGLHTLEEIEAGEVAAKKPTGNKKTGAYTPGEQELRSLEWLQQYDVNQTSGKGEKQ